MHVRTCGWKLEAGCVIARRCSNWLLVVGSNTCALFQDSERLLLNCLLPQSHAIAEITSLHLMSMYLFVPAHHARRLELCIRVLSDASSARFTEWHLLQHA